MRTILTIAGVACGIILASCFAWLSAVYWQEALAGQKLVKLAITASVCVSLMAPACAFLSRRFGWALIVPALVFVSCDIYQNAMGYQTMRGLTVSAEVEAAQIRLATARADLTALPMPSATGEIRRASTWETLNTVLTGRVEKAEADLAALVKPQTNFAYVAIVMALVQLALTMFFACLGKPGKKPSRATQKQPAHRKDPKRVAAAKRGWAKRKAKVQPLRLIAAND